MSGLGGLSGLASGMDTKSLIDQLIAIEKKPIATLNKQRRLIESQQEAYRSLNTKLQALQTKAFALTQLATISSRRAFSSDDKKVTASGTSDTPLGNYSIEVTQLATATKVATSAAGGGGNGIGGIGAILDPVDGAATLDSLNTANRFGTAVTSGSFTVNGQTITIDVTTDSLDSIFTQINTKTGGAVTASVGTGANANKIVFSSASPITVGSSGDSSNFLKAFKLDSAIQSGADLVSTGQIGVVQRTAALNAANFAQSVGTGSAFSINGVNIDYDLTKDSLKDVIDRINASSSGVTASYDTIKDQVVLQSRTTGASSIVLDDKGGSLLQAMGLLNSTATTGQNAIYTVNGSAPLSSSSNTVSDAGGVQGLTLNLVDTTTSPVTINMQVDNGKAQDAAKAFVEAYNAFAEEVEKYTTTADPKERPLLSGDQAAQTIRDRVLSIMNTAVKLSDSSSGIVGEFGLTTGAPGTNPVGSGSQKGLRYEFDPVKMAQLMANNPNRLAEITGASGTGGVFTQLNDYLKGINSVTGTFATTDRVNKDRIKYIDDRVDIISKRVEAKRKRLEAQFTAMEKAISAAQAQQNALSGLMAQLGK